MILSLLTNISHPNTQIRYTAHYTALCVSWLRVIDQEARQVSACHARTDMDAPKSEAAKTIGKQQARRVLFQNH